MKLNLVLIIAVSFGSKVRVHVRILKWREQPISVTEMGEKVLMVHDLWHIYFGPILSHGSARAIFVNCPHER